MKNDSYTKNPNNLYIFHHDYGYDIEKFHKLILENKKIDFKRIFSRIYEEGDTIRTNRKSFF